MPWTAPGSYRRYIIKAKQSPGWRLFCEKSYLPMKVKTAAPRASKAVRIGRKDRLEIKYCSPYNRKNKTIHQAARVFGVTILYSPLVRWNLTVQDGQFYQFKHWL